MACRVFSCARGRTKAEGILSSCFTTGITYIRVKIAVIFVIDTDNRSCRGKGVGQEWQISLGSSNIDNIFVSF